MKRWISLLLVVSMLLGLLSSCAKDNGGEEGILSNLGNVEMMTREEWVILLGQTFGMDQYNGGSAYFSDVSQNSVSYPYVQSSYEWGIFAFESEQLMPDELASREFVAVTALLATGIFNELDVDSLKTVATEECVVYVEGSDWEASISYAEGEVAAAIARDLYLNHEKEEAFEPVFTDAATDLSALSPGDISFVGSGSSGSSGSGSSGSGTVDSSDALEDSPLDDQLNSNVDDETGLTSDDAPSINDEIIDVFDESQELEIQVFRVSSEVATDWEVGTIFLSSPSDLYPEGFPYKIVSIERDSDDVIVEVIPPEFGEVYEDLYFHTVLIPDFDDMILAEGVTKSGGANPMVSNKRGTTQENYYSQLSSTTSAENQVATPLGSGFSDTYEVNFTKGTVAVDREWEDFHLNVSGVIPELPEGVTSETLNDLTSFKETNFTKNIPLSKDKLLQTGESSSWKETLELKDKFTGGYDIIGSLNFSNFKVETTIDWRFLIPRQVVVQISGDITHSLKITGKLTEEISLGTLPIPVPQIPGLTVELGFFLYTTVSGELAVKVVCQNSAKFEYNNGAIKKVADSTVTPSVESKINVDVGAGFRIGLDYAKQDLIDFSVKVGATASAAATVGAEANVTIEELYENNTKTIRKTSEITTSIAEDINLYYPTLTISVAGSAKSWAAKLGLSRSWDILNKDNAPNKKSISAEITPFHLITVVEEITEEEAELIEEVEEELDEEYNEFAMLVIDKYLYSFETGDTEQIKISQFPSGENINHVTFTSTNPSVVTVSSTGGMTAIGAGSAQIYAKTPSGGLQVCAVRVNGNDRVFTADDFL